MVEQQRPDIPIGSSGAQQINKSAGTIAVSTASNLSGMALAKTFLRDVFGHEHWRQDQPEVIRNILEGKSGSAILPTSGGKSLLYQLPAVINYELWNTTTLVVSPLISLIRDQVDGMEKIGPVAFFDSLQDEDDRVANLQRVREGVALIYLSPERLHTATFQRDILGIGTETPLDISMIAFDEAHVISEWGHDFRPSYGPTLKKVLANSFKDTQLLFLTATAGANVLADIEHTIERELDFEYVADIDRPKLFYSGREFPNFNEKLRCLKQELRPQATRRSQDQGKTVVFCGSRQQVDETCDALHSVGVRATKFHAGLDKEERLNAQSQFEKGIKDVMVATTAFGLGVDIPDINSVKVLFTPGSIGQLVQLWGRAGRGGQNASAEVWWSSEDAYMSSYFIRVNNPSNAELKKVFNLFESSVTRDGTRDTKVGRYNSDFMFPSEGQYRHIGSKRRAAATALMECQAIDLFGKDGVKLLVDKRDLDSCLPSELQRTAKIGLAEQNLSKVLYLIAQAEQGDTVLRRLIGEEFRHNTLGDRVSSVDFRHLARIDRNKSLATLHFIQKHDVRLPDFISAATSGKVDAHRIPNTKLNALVGMNYLELRALLQSLSHHGLLRHHRRRNNSYFSVTETGQKYLARAYTDAGKAAPVVALTTYKSLSRCMGQPEAIELLKESLTDWWQEASKQVTDDRTLVKLLKRSFFRKQFIVLDTKRTGKELVIDYLSAGLKSRQKTTAAHPPRARDARNFLNGIFPDRIDALASARKLKGV